MDDDPNMSIDDYTLDLFGESSADRMPKHFFGGASRVLYATAQRADVSKQNYSVAPRHWYVTAMIRCCDCHEEFAFTASEQRFWYEERQFYVDSFPNRCAACRKHQRTLIELKAKYDALIAKALGPCPAELKNEALRLLSDLESHEYELSERMKDNRSRLARQLANLASA